jgi:hypothetical protein
MIPLDDAIDIHLHAGPELFKRSGDAVDFARRAQEAGMAGLVFKAHHEGTMTRAYFAMQQVPGIRLWGGIVLNAFIGGINPVAVAAALQDGARIVWGPTMHSNHHVCHFGAGTYGIPNLHLNPNLALQDGITVLDAEGELVPEMRRIVELVGEHDATMATGHLSDPESRKVVEYCAEKGVRALITHAFFLAQQPTFLREMVELGALVEISAAGAGPVESYLKRNHGGGMRLDVARDFIKEVGADRCVLSTDGGQDYNWPPDAMFQGFVNQLQAVGVPDDDLRHMITVMPRRILAVD